VTKSSEGDHKTLDRALRTTAECIPVERLGEARTARESEHLRDCVRCQTEVALWQEFDASSPSSDEGAAVAWVVAELGRRAGQAAPAAAARPARWLRLPRWAAVAATVAFAALVGYGLWDPEPRVDGRPDASATYRSQQVQSIAPVGTVATAPRALEWAPVSGAVAYDVQVLEVDRVVLWKGVSASPRIELPAGVIAQLLPGKTVLWEVVARNAAGVVVAESGSQKVRVATDSDTLRNP
jgi:hypothetical protein